MIQKREKYDCSLANAHLFNVFVPPFLKLNIKKGGRGEGEWEESSFLKI